MSDIPFAGLAETFHRFPSHAVPQVLLRIHGSHRFVYATLDECALMCWAHAECAGFVDNRAPTEVGDHPTCIFKSSSAGLTARQNKDYYARKSVYSTADHQYVRTPLLYKAHAGPHNVPPVLFAVNDVVSAEEAVVLRETGRRCFSDQQQVRARSTTTTDSDYEHRRVPGDRLRSTYFGEDHSCLAGGTSPLLSTIENRIASLAGIPPHSQENPLMITAARPHDGRYHVRNVHHDKNNGLERVVTVLIYLTNATDDAHGGHTLFPALLRTTGDDAEARDEDDARHRVRLIRAARSLAKAFDLGATTFVDSRAAERTLANARAAGVNPADVYRDDALSEEILELAEEECQRASHGANLALALRPRLGTAIVFRNELAGRGGMGDPRLWHAVCHPREGAERWALQKFKQRCERCMEVVKDEL